jgi:hypothetical protein
METKDWITAVLSALAFVVAVYGVIDRHWETRRATRRQVLDLIDELNEISVKQSENREDDMTRAKSGVSSALNMRREALVAMLDSLIPVVAPGITSREYASMAFALERYGDVSKASKYWKLAVETAEPESVARLFSLRGLGGFTIDCLGDLDAGRQRMRQAIAIASKLSSFRHEMIGETYLLWANREEARDPESPELAELFTALRAEIRAIEHHGRRYNLETRAAARFGPRWIAGNGVNG